MLMPEKVTEEPEARSRAVDPELLSLGRILRLFQEMKEDARDRTLAYLLDRYGFDPPVRRDARGGTDEPF